MSPLAAGIVGRVIVVDGGSSDFTAEMADCAGAEVIKVDRGYGRACLAGALAADTCDVIVFMDGDGADDPAAIRGIVGAIDAGHYDFVISSRVRGKREPGSLAGHQIFASRPHGFLVGLVDGEHYLDMAALRAIRRDTLLTLGVRELTYG